MKYMAICPDICDETTACGDSPAAAAFALACELSDSFDVDEFDLNDGPYDFEIWGAENLDISRSGEFLARYFFGEVFDHLCEDLPMGLDMSLSLDWKPEDKGKLGAFERALASVVASHFPDLTDEYCGVWEATNPVMIIEVHMRQFIRTSTVFRYEFTNRKPGKQAEDAQPAKA